MNKLLWHYTFCLMGVPVGNGMQNFCSTSQWWVAESLWHQSVVGCRISAAPVSGGMQNFCGTSQWWDAEFLWHQSVVGCRISAAPVNNWSLLKHLNKSYLNKSTYFGQ